MTLLDGLYVLIVPVFGVVIAALFIFSYGFKSVEPPVHLLLTDEKKLGGSDKKKKEKLKVKAKEKKPIVNGEQNEKTAVKGKVIENNNSPASGKSVKADPKKADQKIKATTVPVRNVVEPQDAIDGNWIQVPSRVDRKQKRKTDVTDAFAEVSSSDSSPSHKPTEVKPAPQPAVVAAQREPTPEPEPTADVVSPAEPAPVVEEVAKQVQNAEVTRSKETKKSGNNKPAAKAGKAKAESKQVPAKTPAIVIEPAREEPIRELAPEKIVPVAPVSKKAEPAKAKVVPAPAPKKVEPTPPLTNGDVKPASVVPSIEIEQAAVSDSNVAFDELGSTGDAWQETRGQKKKKKARRD